MAEVSDNSFKVAIFPLFRRTILKVTRSLTPRDDLHIFFLLRCLVVKKIELTSCKRSSLKHKSNSQNDYAALKVIDNIKVLWLVIGIHWVLAHNAWHNPPSLTLPYHHKSFLSIAMIICYCCILTIIINCYCCLSPK